MKIVVPSRRETKVAYSLDFDCDDRMGGFSFPCDEDGNVHTAELQVPAARNYAACLAGTNGTRRVGVRKLEGTHREPAVGECSCGAHVTLRGFTNTCHKCGKDYNSAGQQLAPRRQWGEETGEPWYEVP